MTAESSSKMEPDTKDRNRREDIFEIVFFTILVPDMF